MHPQYDGLPLPAPIQLSGHNVYWMEIASTLPEIAHRFRESMVCFLAFDKDRSISPRTTVGNGFIIGAGLNGSYGCVMTARHVLEGAKAVQTPHLRHAPSAIFLPQEASAPSIHEAKLRLAWSSTSAREMLQVNFATYNDATDLACCFAAPIDSSIKTPSEFQPKNIKIDTRVPQVGDEVIMVSFVNMMMREKIFESDAGSSDRELTYDHSISIRLGVVTGVYLGGYNQYRWPCFTTSIPTVPGMSGGLVCKFVRDEPLAACGVICADVDPKPMECGPTECGTSIVGCIWTALQLRLPRRWDFDKSAPNPTILELINEGLFPLPIGGTKDFTIVEHGDETLLCRRQ